MKSNEWRVGVRKAFTLVELLIVILMMSVVSLALYTTLSKGVAIWRRTTTEDELESLNIFFEKLTFDLKNAFIYRSIPCVGKEDELEFAGLVVTPAFQNFAVGKVAYRFDPAQKAITRHQYNISQIYQEENGTTQQVLKNIASAKFLYYSYDESKHEFVWSQDWLKEGLPMAVSIGITLAVGATRTPYVRTVRIPVSN